jgi:ADP-ribose pyrophosphatase YjhB (NUDIX family)
MVRVTPERFDQLISERFKTPNPGSAKERTMLWAISTGKIQAGEAGLSRVRRALEDQLGMDVDLSVVRQGGPFDNPPFIEVPGNG